MECAEQIDDVDENDVETLYNKEAPKTRSGKCLLACVAEAHGYVSSNLFVSKLFKNTFRTDFYAVFVVSLLMVIL